SFLEPLLRAQRSNLVLERIELPVRGDWQRRAPIACIERFDEVAPAVHVAPAFDEIVALEAGVEEAGGVGDDKPLAQREHVGRPELTCPLPGRLASRGIEISGDRLGII